MNTRGLAGWICVCVCVSVTAACTTSSPGTPSATGTNVTAHATATRTDPAAKATPRRAAPAVPPSVTLSQQRTADGSAVTVATFHGPVRYVLHDGSTDPSPPPGVHVQAGPALAAAESQRLLAAFNGGFLMRSRAGGYEQEGHLFRSLRHGFASLVIDRSGHASIGVWGVSTPAPGQALYDVRQNLWPLVMNGQPTAEAARWWRWGGTVGHAEYVARSALGQDAAGNLIYAASMSTVPEDLAQVLARSGAVIGMELDINPEWVQLDTARTAGSTLRAAIPGQNRPASQYVTGWTRDFVAVLG